MKYTEDEIKRIISERVEIRWELATLKNGLIAEWTFTYPTGFKTADVECAYSIDEREYDPVIANEVIMNKITKKVWEICGKYTLGTGDKL